MGAKSVTKADVTSWIERALERENFENYEISLTGKTEKGDGYLGDIVFATVAGTTRDNSKKNINLVIKHGKSSDHARKIAPVRAAFETEIHFYKNVLPAFVALQKEHKVKDLFDAVPKCYAAFVMDNMEVLILDNLKKIGYELYDRVKPLNLNHQKTVLKEYGKLHAVSFALRDQHPDQFRTLINSEDVMTGFLVIKGTQKGIQQAANEAMDIFREKGDFTLAEELERIFFKSPGELALDLFRMDKDNPEAVILHGDCWNNNFMYKYENHDRLSPSKVMILDWQISAIRSPVFDLSYFIYVTASSEGLEKFDELMEVYYDSLSNFLKKLGSDPEQLFPFSALRTHWRKYSLFGLIFAVFILKFGLCEKEDAPELADVAEDDDMGDFLSITLKNKDLYYERLSPVVNHYCNFDF